MSPNLKSKFSIAALVILASASMGLAVSLFIFKIGFTTLVSDSMGPNIPVGSVVITQQFTTSEVRPGQIVKLPLPDSSAQYVHRIVAAKQGNIGFQLTTKGDNNPAQDPWVLEVTSKETPVVIASIPLIGYLNAFTGSFWVQMGLVALVGALIVLALFRYFRS